MCAILYQRGSPTSMKLPIEDLLVQTQQILCDINDKTIHTKLHRVLQRYWLCDDPHSIKHLLAIHESFNAPEVVDYLNKIKQRKKLEEINTTILRLTSQIVAIQSGSNIIEAKTEKYRGGIFKKGLFVLLAILGTFFAAMDGGSVVPSFTTSFAALSNVSNFIVLPLQITFTLMAIIIFYGLELEDLGKSLGIRPFDLSQVFKQYSQQSRHYKKAFELIQNSLSDNNATADQITSLKESFTALNKLYGKFKDKVQEAKHVQENPSFFKSTVHKICTASAAIVWGTVGALGAQVCIPWLLPFIVSSAVATGPIGLGITLGVMTGCFVIGATIYVCVGQKMIKDAIDKVWGTPSKLTNRLIKKDQKIQNIQKNIRELFHTKETLQQLKEENQALRMRTQSITAYPTMPEFNSTERRAQATETAQQYPRIYNAWNLSGLTPPPNPSPSTAREIKTQA